MRKKKLTRPKTRRSSIAESGERAAETRLPPMTAEAAGLKCYCGEPADFYNPKQNYVCKQHNTDPFAVKLAR